MNIIMSYHECSEYNTTKIIYYEWTILVWLRFALNENIIFQPAF